MAHQHTLSLFLLSFVLISTLSLAQDGRYEDRYSFKAPFPTVRGSYLASWEFGGSAVVTEEYVRLTPAIKSRIGSIWNVNPVHFEDWEVIVEFRIGGGGKLGADGLAFWYVSQIKQEGPVFGSKDRWSGLGIFFDTFDNDGMRDNPQVSVVLNDGNIEWREDGKHIQSGGCPSQFRNPYRNVKVKIRHINDMLDVYIDTGTNSWEACAVGMTARLPRDFYFGMTAATGGLFVDNHDVYAFDTYNLDAVPPTEYTNQQQEQQQQQQQPAPPQQQPNTWNKPPATQDDRPFDDILSKLNDIGGQPADPNQPPPPPPQQQPPQQQPPQQQPPQQQPPQQQPPPPQQYQQPPPPPQQQQQQPPPPPQQQQQQQPLPHQAQYQPQYQQAENLLKDVLTGLSDLSNKVTGLQQTYQSGSGSANSAALDTKLEQVLRQQSIIAEAFGNLLKTVALKSELEEMKSLQNSYFGNVQKDIVDVRSAINDLKATVNTKLGARGEDILRSLEEVTQNVNQLKKGVDQTKESTQKIAGNLQQNQQDITSTIEKHTTFGFWSYFLFVQAIFIFGFVWWKKHRDDNNKKLI